MLFPPIRFALTVVEEAPTSQELIHNLRGSAKFHGAAALVLSQTAGFGRRGRTWQSPKGNLALSFGVLIPPHSPALPLLPFATGLAAYRVAMGFLPPLADLRLKWPNDIYLHGKKLAGLIAQAHQAPESGTEVVVGIGINLAEAPTGLDQATTSLKEYGEAPSPETFAKLMLHELEKIFAEFSGFPPLREEWESAARLQESKMVLVGEGSLLQPMELLSTGELLVRDENGEERKLASEEVSLRLS